MKHFYLIIFIILSVSACVSEPLIYFSNSQPENRKTEKKIKKAYLGKYQSLSDSSILEINSDAIIRKYYSFHIDSVQRDTINGLSQIKVHKSDCLNIDTIFSFAHNEILKHTKGIYFLNTKIDENKWTLELLKKLDKNYIEVLNLCYGSAFSNDSSTCEISEIEDLQNCSRIEVSYFDGDSTRIRDYKVEIGQRELINFIKSGGFVNIEVYEKLNNSN